MPGAVEVEPIQYEVEGHVARIWLNRPHKRNSVSQQLLEELDEARRRAEEDAEQAPCPARRLSPMQPMSPPRRN